MFLNKFYYETEHVSGRNNVVADTLSRYPPELSDPSGMVDRTTVVAAEFLVGLFEVDDLPRLRETFEGLGDHQLEDTFFGPIFCFLLGYPTVLSRAQVRVFPQIEVYNDVLLLRNFHSGVRLVLPENFINCTILAYHQLYVETALGDE